MLSPAVRPSMLPLAYFLLCIFCQILFISALALFIPHLAQSISFDIFNALGMLLGLWVAIRFGGAPAIRFSRPRKCLPVCVLAFAGGLLLSYLDLQAMAAWENPALTGNFASIRASIQAHEYLRASLLILPCCLFYPILEEGIFRGMLFEAFLRTNRSRFLSIILVSGLFALMHLTSRLEVLPVLDLFLLGLVLSWLTLRSASLIPAVVLHSAFNAMAVAVQARLF